MITIIIENNFKYGIIKKYAWNSMKSIMLCNQILNLDYVWIVYIWDMFSVTLFTS